MIVGWDNEKCTALAPTIFQRFVISKLATCRVPSLFTCVPTSSLIFTRYPIGTWVTCYPVTAALNPISTPTVWSSACSRYKMQQPGWSLELVDKSR